MKHTFNINSRLRPYALSCLIILFAFLFYNLLNIFLLKDLQYQQLITLSHEQSLMQHDIKGVPPIPFLNKQEFIDNPLPGKEKGDGYRSLNEFHNNYIVRLIHGLKNSSSAQYHMAIAQYFERLSKLDYRNLERELPFFSMDAFTATTDQTDQANYREQIAKMQSHYEKEALYHFQKAIRLNPLFGQGHIFLAEYLDTIYKKRWSGGKYNPQIKKIVVHHFEAALKLNSQWDHSYHAYGNWLFSFARSEEVCSDSDYFQQIIDLAVRMYKESTMKWNTMVFFEGIEKYNAFTNSYDELKKIVPETPQFFSSFAKYLQRKGHWEIYEDDFYHDIQSHTDRFPLYQAIVEYLCQKKRFTEGIYLLREYLRDFPDDIPARLWLGNLLFYTVRNKEEGIQEVEIALKYNHEDLNTLSSYGKMLFHYDEYERSVEVLKRVFSRDARKHEVCFLIAQSYEKLLNILEAEKFYEKAISLNPNSTEYKRHLARLRLKLKIDNY